MKRKAAKEEHVKEHIKEHVKKDPYTTSSIPDEVEHIKEVEPFTGAPAKDHLAVRIAALEEVLEKIKHKVNQLPNCGDKI